jgi:hypothetical protein
MPSNVQTPVSPSPISQSRLILDPRVLVRMTIGSHPTTFRGPALPLRELDSCKANGPIHQYRRLGQQPFRLLEDAVNGAVQYAKWASELSDREARPNGASIRAVRCSDPICRIEARGEERPEPPYLLNN